MIQVYKKNDLFVIEDTITETIYPNLTREEALVLLKKFDRDEPEDRCDFAIKEDNISFEYASIDDKDKTIAEQRKQITDLEAKLTEKEKERELDNSFWKQECDSLQKTLVEKDKEIEKLTEELDDKNFCKNFVDLYTENKLKTQMLQENWKDKISFAVDILEELADCSNYINSKLGFESGSYVSEKSIRDKIKYLKGNKYE